MLNEPFTNLIGIFQRDSSLFHTERPPTLDEITCVISSFTFISIHFYACLKATVILKYIDLYFLKTMSAFRIIACKTELVSPSYIDAPN